MEVGPQNLRNEARTRTPIQYLLYGTRTQFAHSLFHRAELHRASQAAFLLETFPSEITETLTFTLTICAYHALGRAFWGSVADLTDQPALSFVLARLAHTEPERLTRPNYYRDNRPATERTMLSFPYVRVRDCGPLSIDRQDVTFINISLHEIDIDLNGCQGPRPRRFFAKHPKDEELPFVPLRALSICENIAQVVANQLQQKAADRRAR